MSDAKASKAQLRQTLRRRRQSLHLNEQKIAAQALTAFIEQLPGWPEAQCIGVYLPADGEIDTSALVTLCRAQRKQLFLPVIQTDRSLRFAQWLPDQPLAANRYGIPEPLAKAHSHAVDHLDILFMPLVGWDLQGGRLGMGGGFYDRTLIGDHSPLLVGMAHANQQVTSIPREEWDVPLNFIVTDTALHSIRRP